MHYRIITALAIIVGVEACRVILGWVFGIDWLTRITPAGINMKFPTAVSFLMSAVGLYYISRTAKDDHGTAQIVLPGIALLIFSIMSALFVSAVFGVKAGLDSPFTKEASSIYAAGAGMPALPTMINFVLFGFACIFSLFPGGTQRRSILIAGCIIFLIGLIGMAGYILQVPRLYYELGGPFVPIAFNTAILFVLLGAGLSIIGRHKNNEA